MAQITFANRGGGGGGGGGGGADPTTAALIAQLLRRSAAPTDIRTIGGGFANTASKLLDANTAKRLQNKQTAAQVAQRQQFGQTVGGALPAAPQGAIQTPDVDDVLPEDQRRGPPPADRFAIARALAQNLGQTGNPQTQQLLRSILPALLDPSKSIDFARRRAEAVREPIAAAGRRAAATREPIGEAGRRAAATRDPERNPINRRLAVLSKIEGGRDLTEAELRERDALLESKAAGNAIQPFIRKTLRANKGIGKSPDATAAKKDDEGGFIKFLGNLLGGSGD